MGTSPRGRPIDLAPYLNASTADVGAAFDPLYERAVERLPAGARSLRGLPFLLAERDAARRWLIVREPIRIELPSVGAVSHVVIAHFCDAWRATDGTRPAGLPVGWVVGAGQPLGHLGCCQHRGVMAHAWLPVAASLRRRSAFAA